MTKPHGLHIAGGIGVELLNAINAPLHNHPGQLSAKLPKLEGETTTLHFPDAIASKSGVEMTDGERRDKQWATDERHRPGLSTNTI